MKLISTHEFKFIETNGIKLHVLCAGDTNNPLMVLLHGFPEFHKGWEAQIDDMVNTGYYVMVPDQRGYNLSDKPWFIGDYKIDKLSLDIVGLIDHSGKKKAVVAGHDWGAAVAWQMGLAHHDRLERLIIVNVPHPKTLGKFLKIDKEQKKKSSYMVRFQIPFIPQFLMRKNNFKVLEKTLKRTSLEGTYSDEDIEEYKQAWGQKRAIPCMLNWYRAAFRRKVKLENSKVPIKTLIIWGKKDRFLKWEMGVDSLRYCGDGRIEFIDDATHWVLKERPEIVNKLMIEFLK